MSYETCDRCGGSGEIDCPKCNGLFASTPGKFLIVLSEDGVHYEDCAHCDGTGYISCPTCGGSGEVSEDD